MGVVEEAEEVEEDDGDSGEVNGADAVFVRAPVLSTCPHSTVASVGAVDSDVFGSEKNKLRRMWVRDFGGPIGGCSWEEWSLIELVDSGDDSNDCIGFNSFL